jgi:hypothetical protein
LTFGLAEGDAVRKIECRFSQLMRLPKLLINNDFSGKAEDIYLFIDGPPQAAFGSSAGDRQMLDYTHCSNEKIRFQSCFWRWRATLK